MEGLTSTLDNFSIADLTDPNHPKNRVT
jgi:hypothetical protein